MPLNIPESLQNSKAFDLINKNQDLKNHPERELDFSNNPFIGMTISLSGRLSRKHENWKAEIEKHGGKVANTAIGVTCIVASDTERDRGGSSRITEALFCITQLISVPGKPLHMYRRRGRIGDNDDVDELLQEWDDVDEAINEFVKLFEELTGNEFELWEREKQFKKKMHKFMPIDIV